MTSLTLYILLLIMKFVWLKPKRLKISKKINLKNEFIIIFRTNLKNNNY
jgi:hypothetical protein